MRRLVGLDPDEPGMWALEDIYVGELELDLE